jgi:glycosyltransferase involved in cell wall biosynthesis
LPEDLAVPLVFTNHDKGSLYREVAYPDLRGFLWARYYKRRESTAVKRATQLVFPSESAMELLIAHYPELESTIRAKTRVIHTGIEDPLNALRDYAGSAPGSGDVINVGHHIPDKGVEVALRLFAQLRRRRPAWRFVNFGQQTLLTPSLRRLAEELGIASVTDFRGVRSSTEVLGALRSAVLVLHTPINVVFDLSLLEAMAMGTAVVATNAKGNLEALGDAYPLAVSPQDAALNADQLRMIDDPQTLRAIGTALRQSYLSRFQPEGMVYSHAELWKELAGRARSQPCAAARTTPDRVRVEA